MFEVTSQYLSPCENTEVIKQGQFATREKAVNFVIDQHFENFSSYYSELKKARKWLFKNIMLLPEDQFFESYGDYEPNSTTHTFLEQNHFNTTNGTRFDHWFVCRTNDSAAASQSEKLSGSEEKVQEQDTDTENETEDEESSEQESETTTDEEDCNQKKRNSSTLEPLETADVYLKKPKT